MKIISSATSVALLLLLVLTIKDGSWAFVNNPSSHNSRINRWSRKDAGGTKRTMTTTNPSSPNDEAAAKAMTEYLAKSHEEKLKNLQLLREKDNYIQKLTKELESFKSGALTTTATSSVSSIPAPPGVSSLLSAVDDVEVKLTAYQTFIANYVVKAQEEKYRAIKRAEAAVEKKYQEKLQLLLQQSSPTPTIAPSTKESTIPLLDQGSSTTTAAAADIQKSISTTRVNIGAAIANGEYLGESVQKRVDQVVPSSSSTTSVGITTPSHTKLFEIRSVKVLQMANAGQSRWGEAEIQKLKNTPSTTTTTSQQPPSISTKSTTTSVDTFRPVTLEERLRLGAKLEPKISSTPSPPLTHLGKESLYSLRTAKVMESANAGKSRWGDAEIMKLQHLPKEPKAPRSDALYTMRTTKVIQSADAGKSRWGDAEIKKLSTAASAESIFKPPSSPTNFLSRNNHHVANVGALLISSYLLTLLGLSGAWAS